MIRSTLRRGFTYAVVLVALSTPAMLRASTDPKVPAAPKHATPMPETATTSTSLVKPLPPKPEAPCEKFPAPVTIQDRWKELGGAKTLGCFVSMEDESYHFRMGQIKPVPKYGPSATYAAIRGADTFVHLYWTSIQRPMYWLVLLKYDGAIVNQDRYEPGQNANVGGTYANDVVVHPGGRHGRIEIGMEGCYTGVIVNLGSDCLGWSNATIAMEL